MFKQYKYIMVNVFNFYVLYEWLKLVGWKVFWQWLVDLIVVFYEKWCNVCKKKKLCCCYVRFVLVILWVLIDGSKGSGVCVMGMFRVNDIIGEMLGELVFFGVIFNWEWMMEFWCLDFDDVVVVEFYFKEQGNWVWVVRYFVYFFCEIFIRKMEGKWRMLIVVSRQLFDGEEIIVKYGCGYYRNQVYGIVEGF